MSVSKPLVVTSLYGDPSRAKLGPAIEIVYIAHHPPVWLFKLILERCPNLKKIQTTPLNEGKILASVPGLLAERGINLVFEYLPKSDKARGKKFFARQRFLNELSGAALDRLNRLLAIQHPGTIALLHYYGARGYAERTSQDICQEFRQFRYPGSLSTMIGAVTHFLEGTTPANIQARKIARVLLKRIASLPKINPLRTSIRLDATPALWSLRLLFAQAPRLKTLEMSPYHLRSMKPDVRQLLADRNIKLVARRLRARRHSKRKLVLRSELLKRISNQQRSAAEGIDDSTRAQIEKVGTLVAEHWNKEGSAFGLAATTDAYRVALYFLHTHCGWSYEEIHRNLGLHRTTLAERAYEEISTRRAKRCTSGVRKYHHRQFKRRVAAIEAALKKYT